MTYHFGRGWSRWVPYLLLFPGIFFYVVIALGPSLATAVYSFTDATLPGLVRLTGNPRLWRKPL